MRGVTSRRWKKSFHPVGGDSLWQTVRLHGESFHLISNVRGEREAHGGSSSMAFVGFALC